MNRKKLQKGKKQQKNKTKRKFAQARQISRMKGTEKGEEKTRRNDGNACFLP